MISTIRQMKESDIDAVYALETSVHITPWQKNILRDCVLVGYDCHVIELHDDDTSPLLAGYIISRIHNDICHILNFCIAKQVQSQGLGRELLQKIIHSLSEYKKASSIVLEVRPSNSRALQLYSSLGFEQIEIKKNYYKDEHHMEDAIFLNKNLCS